MENEFFDNTFVGSLAIWPFNAFSVPASVVLLVASRYALPAYGDRRIWFEAQACLIIMSSYSGVRFENKFSG